MAVVEPQPGVTLDVADIRARLKTSLADYKVPKHIEIQAEPAARGFRQDLQAPPARSLLGAGGAEDLVRVVPANAGTHTRASRCVRCRSRLSTPAGDHGSGFAGRRGVESAPPPSSSCAAAKKLQTLDCRAASGAAAHVPPDHAFRRRNPVQSRRRRAGARGGRAAARTTSGCSGASSATPCATRRAPTCSTWSSASARPRSASTATRTARRGASSKPSSTACRSPRPCASCAPSAIFPTSPTSPRTRTTSARCARAAPPRARRGRARWPRRWRMRAAAGISTPPSCASSSRPRWSARC